MGWLWGHGIILQSQGHQESMPVLIIPEPACLPTTKDLISQPPPLLSSLWADAYIFIIFILLLFDSFIHLHNNF